MDDIANCAYYTCKSAVFEDPQYFKELTRIRDKIYFSRSIAVASVVATAVTVVLLALYAVLSSLLSEEKRESYLRPAPLAYCLLVAFILLHLAVYAMSRYYYADYESTYVRRCYGYYISKLEFPKALGQHHSSPGNEVSPVRPAKDAGESGVSSEK
jgi:hypothetical protein